MNRERYIKPKIDKYIQLYSKKAKADEAVQTLKLTGAINVTDGGATYSNNQAATISAPISGTQPTISLTVSNGVITGGTISSFANAVYNTNAPPILTLTQTNTTAVKSVEIVSSGVNYEEPPILRFGLPSTVRRAIGTAVLTNNVLTSITIVDGGLGYSQVPEVQLQIKNFNPNNPQYTPAVITAVLTSGVITSFNITSGGDYLGYSINDLELFIARPINTAIATATCTINANGEVNSVTITNEGSGYLSPPIIELFSPDEGETFAVFKSYLYLGYGANIILDYDFVPTTIYRYTWDLESPIEINENALLQVVHRECYNVQAPDNVKLIVMRLHDISTKSIVNTKNTSENPDFNGGIIVDIGKVDRLVTNEIILEINPQIINRITLSLNHDISGVEGFNSGIEFLVILKVTEKEPSIIEYGTLNNINYLQ